MGTLGMGTSKPLGKALSPIFHHGKLRHVPFPHTPERSSLYTWRFILFQCTGRGHFLTCNGKKRTIFFFFPRKSEISFLRQLMFCSVATRVAPHQFSCRFRRAPMSLILIGFRQPFLSPSEKEFRRTRSQNTWLAVGVRWRFRCGRCLLFYNFNYFFYLPHFYASHQFGLQFLGVILQHKWFTYILRSNLVCGVSRERKYHCSVQVTSGFSSHGWPLTYFIKREHDVLANVFSWEPVCTKISGGIMNLYLIVLP